MTILLGIIAFHFCVLFSARFFRKRSVQTIFWVFFFSLMITLWVVFGMFTMEMPDTADRFY